MRSSAKARAAVIVAALVLVPGVLAQSSSQPQRLYNEALSRDAELRRELENHNGASPAGSLLRRIRVLVTSYEDLSRLFPSSGYGDNALWQGATLASAAFWEFGEAEDRETALELLDDLVERFPTSALVKQVPAEARRLAAAASPSRAAAPPPSLGAPPPSRSAATPSRSAATPSRSAVTQPGSAVPPARLDAEPASTPMAPSATMKTPSAPPAAGTVPPAASPAPSGSAVLTAIRREVLPDAIRITLALDHEVSFRDERLETPPRVFIDLRNVAAISSLKGATIPFPDDDLVTQARVGLQLGSRTRVVFDLASAARYSVYALYNPYRIVIDFERTAAADREDARTAPRPGAHVNASVLQAAATPARRTPPVAAIPPPVLDAPPAAAATNRGGGFSLSRQLGLGVASVVIDPGHGGQDPGARGRGLNEAALVLDLALRLEKLLLKQPGVQVVLTRRTNAYVPLEERTAIANRAGADLFLSIHANASSNAAAQGIETYYLNFAPNPEAEAIAARENAASTQRMRQLPDIVRAIALNNKIDESRDFAGIVQKTLYERLRKSNRSIRNLGVKQAPFMVLIGATMPSVLAEISFLTNRQEADLLKTDKYRQQIAEALLAGVMRYQESLKKVTAIAAN